MTPTTNPPTSPTTPTETPTPAPTSARPDRSPRSLARSAGLLYITIVVLGLFAEVGVRGRLIAPDDPATTAANILESEWLFRAGFAADAVVFLADAALAVLLYRLLAPIDRTLSMLAAAFRLMQTAILGMNLLHMFEAIRVLTDAPYLSTGGRDLEAMALLAMDRHRYGYILALTFFGVATMLIGRMATRSPRLPTALGLVLLAAGLGYVVDAGMFFLIPGYDGAVSGVVLAPAVVSETWFALWLLIRAGRRPHPTATAA